MVPRTLSIVLSLVAIAGGSISLSGWLLGIPRLTDWDNDGIAMLANASLAAAAAGISLLALVWSSPDRTERFRRIVWPFGGLTALLGGLTLSQHLFGWDLGIDTFLVYPSWGERAAAAPGRMGPPASSTYMLLGCALLLASSRSGSRARRAAAALATVASLPSFVATTAYFYGADPLFSLPYITGIARQTAAILLGLTVGTVLTIHDFGLGEILRRDDAAGLLFRRLFPVGLGLLLVTGWAEDYGLRQGWYDSNFGNAALTVLRGLMLTALLWWTARTVIQQVERRNRAESALRESESKLAALIEKLPIGVGVADEAGNQRSLNQAGLEIHGFDSLEDMFAELKKDRTLFELRDSDGDVVPVSEWPLSRALRGDFVADYEVSVRRLPDGEERVVSYTAVPIVDDIGKARSVVFVMQDITNRKEAERALRDSEEFNRAVIESSSDCIKLLDLDGNLRYMNPSGREMMEIDDFTSVSGKKWVGFWSDEARPIAEAAVDEALDGGVGRFRSYCQTAKGSLKYWDVMVSTVPGADGRPLQLLAVSREMTEVKRIEEALRESEERVRMAVESADIGTWDYNLVTGDLLWSDRCKGIFGLASDAEIDYSVFLERLHPDDRKSVDADVKASFDPRGTGRYDRDYRVVWSDGTIRWVAAKGQAYFEGEGSKRVAVRMMGTVLDQTERKQSEARLKEEVATTDALRRIGSLLAAELDMDKLVQAVTDVATNLTEAEFGAFFYNEEGDDGEYYTLYTVSGVPRELFDRFPMPRKTAIFEPTFRGLGSLRLDDVVSDSRYGKTAPHYGMPEGHLPVRSYLAVPVTSRSGEVLGALFFGHSRVAVFNERHQNLAEGIAAQAAVAIDNAALYRKAQEQAEELLEADQRKDEFLATLAHELRNPLAAIRTATSLLRRFQDDPERLSDMTDVLERQTGQLVHLIDDLMDVSRITRGKIQLRRRRIALADIIRQAVDTCAPIVEREEQTLLVQLPDTALGVEGDPVRLAQIFGNLLNNASKYSDPRTTIRIEAEALGRDVAVSIEDEGIGIPEDELTSIFDMFSQVDSRLHRTRGGLGIGLTLVKRLVELHGGTVTAHSEGPGAGSRFVVRLPLAEPGPDHEKAEPAEAVDVPARNGTQRRVLVVDDNVDAARTLALSLSTAGCETRMAHEGESAVAEAESFRPDAILLDIGMPGMSGYEVCQAIREESWGAGIVIVAVTGWGQDDVRRRSVASGFDAHLVKPVQSSSRLLALIDELLPSGRTTTSSLT